MGGKSRKGGGVTREYIQRLIQERREIKSKKKKKKPAKKGFFKINDAE